MRLTHRPHVVARTVPHGGPRRARAPAPRATPADPADPLAALLPDIDGDLAGLHELEGATVDDGGVVTTFRNDTAALDALANGVAIFDRSHCARARVAGDGALRFLHGQLTAAFEGVEPGTVVEAVLCTPTGRAVDLATVAITGPTSALVLAAPSQDTGGKSIAAALDAVAFPADGVSVADVGAATVQFTLAGPAAADLLTRLGVTTAPPPNTHTLLAGGGAPVVLLRSSPLGRTSLAFTLIADAAAGADLWRAAVTAGATPAGDAAWARARVAAGVPAAGAELDGTATPYEAGLASRVDASKGCFRGAEALAKVGRTGGTKRHLWRVAVSGDVAAGARLDPLNAPPAGPPAGVVTSVATDIDDAAIGLAYVSTSRAGGELAPGLELSAAGGGSVKLVAPAGDGAFSPTTDGAPSEAAAAAPEATDDREARLAAMQARLAAWQAEQGQGGG